MKYDHIKLLKIYFSKYRFHIFLNIFGFGVALMFIILFGLYIQREYAVDDYHVNKDRIYRLMSNEGDRWAIPASYDLKERYPDIEAITAIIGDQIYFKDEKNELFIEDVLLVDSCFFSIFSYNFKEGNPQSCFNVKNEVVITQRFAQKLFGNNPVLGKIIKTDGSEFVVGGVVEDIDCSHLKNFQMIAPMSCAAEITGTDNVDKRFEICRADLYVLTQPDVDQARLTDKITTYLNDAPDKYWAFSNNGVNGLRLEPLKEIYLNPLQTRDWILNNDPAFLLTLGVAILAILLFAIINYINFSVAQTTLRAKEASLRRLLGASKFELFSNLIIESFVLCILALILALILSKLCELWFQQIMETTVVVRELFTSRNLLVLLSSVVAISFISAIIPGIMIVGYKPIEVVQGTFRRKTKMVYSKILIAIQYTITIALVGCTIIIIKQVHFMTKGDIGFDRDMIIVCNAYIPASERNIYQSTFMSIAGVESVGFSRGGPFMSGQNLSFTTSDQKSYSFKKYEGDSMFFNMLNFEVVQSQNNGSQNAVWMNETGWRKSGLQKNESEFRVNSKFSVEVKGVLKDFHFENYEKPITEVMIGNLGEQSSAWQMWLKISPQNFLATYDKIGDEYNKLQEGELFESQAGFLNSYIDKVYKRQKRLSAMISCFAIIAVVISSLGLFAMSVYQMKQKTKEVAIRKVLGSTNNRVMSLLLFQVVKILMVSTLIAVPIILFLGRDWLSNYAYHIPLSWTIFAIAAISIISIALLTILGLTIKTAHANPVTYLHK